MIEFLNTVQFASPWWLASILLLPIVAWLRGRRATDALVVPFAGSWRRSQFGGQSKLPAALAYSTIVFVIIALARPQSVLTERQSKSKGYDIIIAIDLSMSMLAEDYVTDGQRVNRLQAVKPVLSAFINKRENDRIGIVAFSGRAYTVSPLTFDHDWLARQTERLKIGLIEDGTAIGDAIAVSTSRLQEGAKERSGEREGAFLILLTDGTNNSGMLEPVDGAKLAKDAGVKVYTIAAGRDGWVPFPRLDAAGRRIGTTKEFMRVDTATLQTIADLTEGEFFNAGDTDTIDRAFEKISETSQIEFEVNQYSIVTELFPYLLNVAGAFATLSLLSISFVRRKEVAL